MKKFSLLALAVVATVTFAADASAAQYTSYRKMNDTVSEELGVISGGESGTLSSQVTGEVKVGNSYVNAASFGVASGELDIGSSIIFTYNVRGDLGGYSFGFDVDPPEEKALVELGTYPQNGTSDYLTVIQEAANAAEGYAKTFIVSISNLNPASVNAFYSAFVVTGGASPWSGVVDAYYYGSPANVPLPAALPLFGLGLAGLAGYRRLKKGNKAA